AAEDPILPRREPAENLRLHRFRPGEAQIGLKPRQGVGREAGALLKREAHLLVPIDLVVGGRNEAQCGSGFGLERLGNRLPGALQTVGLAKETCRETAEAVRYRISPEIER